MDRIVVVRPQGARDTKVTAPYPTHTAANRPNPEQRCTLYHGSEMHFRHTSAAAVLLLARKPIYPEVAVFEVIVSIGSLILAATGLWRLYQR